LILSSLSHYKYLTLYIQLTPNGGTDDENCGFPVLVIAAVIADHCGMKTCKLAGLAV